jgi:molybdenum cofactor cytidylyltransferase
MLSIAVIPAAGHSRRMGRAKLLLPWRDKPIIEHVLEAWGASRADHVVVVIRAEDTVLQETALRCGADVARADPPPEQMKDSVVVGLEYARRAWSPGPADVWLLAPADMPRLNPGIINLLLEEYDSGNPQILIPKAGDKNGHPVLFPWRLADEVRALGADEGINALRRRFPSRLVTIDDPAVFDDLDTPEDYRKLGD